MGDRTAIEWTDLTWNPWMGCTKVSAGCDLCYMFREQPQYGNDPSVVRRSKTKFNDPLKWERQLATTGERKLVFTCSWSDWFHKDADAWRDEAWAIIKQTPHLTYQILTKRPGRIARHLPRDWGHGYENVWLGVSCESDDVRHRVTQLADVPARVRFVSAEPLIAPLMLAGIFGDMQYHGAIHWLIIGGESGGNDRREMKLEWARDLILQCRDFDVAPFVKQLGGPVNAKRGDPAEWPEDLRVREWPAGYEVQHA